MRAVLFGVGAVGARIARILVSDSRFESIEVRDTSPAKRIRVAGSLGQSVVSSGSREIEKGTDVVVIATPVGSQVSLARRSVQAGASVVTTTCDIDETRALLDADQEALYQGVPLLVGAGFMPGLTCLLARLGAEDMDMVDEIHVSKAGTGGPACARQHHRSLSSSAVDWRDGRWIRRLGGSGRELCWFPEPVAGLDCYRGGLSDALLLVPEFPGVGRVTARMAATRRDRFTAFLPMLRRPHPEGLLGAVRVEIRGWRGPERRLAVMGAQHWPAAATAVVAASTVFHLLDHKVLPGARGLAGIAEYRRLLQAIRIQGLRLERFEGATTFS